MEEKHRWYTRTRKEIRINQEIIEAHHYCGVQDICRGGEKQTGEERGMIPESQARFRKGRSTIDNIWVLNHLLRRGKKEGRRRTFMCCSQSLRQLSIMWTESYQEGNEEQRNK